MKLNPVDRRNINAGVFTVTQYFGEIGQHMAFDVRKAFHQKDADYRAMMVYGRRINVEAPGALLPEFTSGMLSIERPPFPLPGRYVFECTEPTFYLCLLHRPGASIRFEYVRDETPEFQLNPGDIFALGSGALLAAGLPRIGPAILYASKPADIKCLESCRGIRGHLTEQV